MKTYRNFVLSLAALFFGLLLIPQAAHAASVNCPTEPKTGVPIVSGEVYAGANCTLNAPTDVDGFVFNATSGNIYQVTAGVASSTQNMCMTIYDPNGKQVYTGCTGIDQGGYPYVQADLTIAVTGAYSVDLSEEGAGTVNYGISLERLYPTPTDAQAVTLGQLYTGNIAPVADIAAFTFAGVTTGQFQAAASLPSGATGNICETVYSPLGATVASGCTGAFQGGNTYVDLDFTPTQAGTYLVLVSEQTNSATTSYDFEVSCLSGNCGTTKTPPCTLKDSLSYSSTTTTLTMNFTEGNTAVDTWNAWLTEQNTMTPLFSVSQPITTTQTITKTTTLSPAGTVGVLSTLTTPTKGIICSVYTQINTGTP